MLSAELWIQIVGYLGLPDRRRSHDHFDQFPLALDEPSERGEGYKTLRNVCVASKLLCDIAQPLLFSYLSLRRLRRHGFLIEAPRECLARLEGVEVFLKQSDKRRSWPTAVVIELANLIGIESSPGSDVWDVLIKIEATALRILGSVTGVRKLFIRHVVLGRLLQAEIIRICSLRSFVVLDIADVALSTEDDAFDVAYPVDKSSIFAREICVGCSISQKPFFNWILHLIEAPTVRVLRASQSGASTAIMKLVSQQPEYASLPNLTEITLFDPPKRHINLFVDFAMKCPEVRKLQLHTSGDVNRADFHPVWAGYASHKLFPHLQQYYGGSELALDIIRDRPLTLISLNHIGNEKYLRPDMLLGPASSTGAVTKLELHHLLWDKEFLRHIFKACPALQTLGISVEYLPSNYMGWIQESFVLGVQRFSDLRHLSIEPVCEDHQLCWDNSVVTYALSNLSHSGHKLQQAAFGDEVSWYKTLEGKWLPEDTSTIEDEVDGEDDDDSGLNEEDGDESEDM